MLFHSSAPFYKILVPTVDTLRYDFLVHHLIAVERPVLLVGPVGTGKTSVAQGVLQKLDPQVFNLLTVNLSAQVCGCRLHKYSPFNTCLCNIDHLKQCTRNH